MNKEIEKLWNYIFELEERIKELERKLEIKEKNKVQSLLDYVRS